MICESQINIIKKDYKYNSKEMPTLRHRIKKINWIFNDNNKKKKIDNKMFLYKAGR